MSTIDTSMTLGLNNASGEDARVDHALEDQASEGREPDQDLEDDVSDDEGETQSDDEGGSDAPARRGDETGADAIEEARAQAEFDQLVRGEQDGSTPKPEPKTESRATNDAPAFDVASLLEGEEENLVENFGLDEMSAKKIVAAQAKRYEAILGQVDKRTKEAVEAAIGPYKGVFEESRQRAAREMTASIDRSVDEWATSKKIAGVGTSAQMKGSERLFRTVIVREAQKIMGSLPESSRSKVSDAALFDAALPTATLYMQTKGFKIGSSVPSSPKYTTSPQSQANGSVTRPKGSLPAASAASANKPGGNTQGPPSKASTLAKMRRIAATS